jgi:hypothetical protein
MLIRRAALTALILAGPALAAGCGHTCCRQTCCPAAPVDACDASATPAAPVAAPQTGTPAGAPGKERLPLPTPAPEPLKPNGV